MFQNPAQKLTASNTHKHTPAYDSELQQVLEHILHEQSRDDAHGGGQGCRADPLSLEGALVDARGNHQRGDTLSGRREGGSMGL